MAIFSGKVEHDNFGPEEKSACGSVSRGKFSAASEGWADELSNLIRSHDDQLLFVQCKQGVEMINRGS